MSFEHGITFDPAMLSCGRILNQKFLAEALARGLSEFREYSVESEAPRSVAVAAATEGCMVAERVHFLDVRDPDEEKYFFDSGDVLVYYAYYGNYACHIDVAAATAEKADATIQRFVKALPKIKHTDPDVVPVNFWAMTRLGVNSRIRKIGAPAWGDIIANYTQKARIGLDEVMGLTPPMNAGKLLLWHGEPGTGKSYAIRALMRQWRTWCQAHYIVDPEKFFGEADYMLSVILDKDDECEKAPVAVGSQSKEIEIGSQPWHLLVMEDADEFLQADAKIRQGQALSRLLNMADGLIGQGLNILVLITTNEPLGKIHPAIQREGRCLANIEFGRLTVDEVGAWAEVHNLPDFQKEDNQLLSDLYAKARTQAQVKATVDKRRVGFVR